MRRFEQQYEWWKKLAAAGDQEEMCLAVMVRVLNAIHMARRNRCHGGHLQKSVNVTVGVLKKGEDQRQVDRVVASVSAFLRMFKCYPLRKKKEVVTSCGELEVHIMFVGNIHLLSMESLSGIERKWSRLERYRKSGKKESVAEQPTPLSPEEQAIRFLRSH